MPDATPCIYQLEVVERPALANLVEAAQRDPGGLDAVRVLMELQRPGLPSDKEVRASLCWSCDYWADSSSFEHRRGIDGDDLVRAAEAFALTLGTVYAAADGLYAVLELDESGIADALAAAVVGSLPERFVGRYARLARRRARVSD